MWKLVLGCVLWGEVFGSWLGGCWEWFVVGDVVFGCGWKVDYGNFVLGCYCLVGFSEFAALKKLGG